MKYLTRLEHLTVEFLKQQQEDWRRGWLIGGGMGADKKSIEHAKHAIEYLQTAIDALENK